MGNKRNTQIINGNYCSKCEESLELPRIDGHYMLHEIQHIIHFEKGIFYTIKELLLRPGQNVKMFITKNRSRLIKPVVFIIITSLIYTIINNIFHIESGYINFEDTNNVNNSSQSSIGGIFNWIQDHYGYANIVVGMFIAFWLRLFFKKYDYNFFEILILLCFVMGIDMLLFAIFAILEGLTHFHLMQISGFIGIAYSTWAIGQFFDEYNLVSYIKSFFAYSIGMLTFSFSALLLGGVIDFLQKIKIP
ncbi:DUF3667 domain-containing protein [Arcicella sp. LKC2W]|uniref:DUF3667 domain-containing protein n=1 Tax=Arcicella sp. LKC2W TaxID=2984198 RepID=UPI002B209A49|nr:DUF3667 domain-containing protein [Arcicella sp. LKC2W]MEA5461123.1 DUF3667 domain-containing protein [Arcicella sp. LKC2W]